MKENFVYLAMMTLLTGLFLTACGQEKLPTGNKPFEIKPSNFTSHIDHPYWPMPVGAKWIYKETDDEGAVRDVTVTVLDRTKKIQGVKVQVVHDVVREDGKISEDTYDWYAQDKEGNLWYFGEDTTEYENGKASKEGSWQAGKDGAMAGIILPAHPQKGMHYREEYYKGHAEDAASIFSTEEMVEVPYGKYKHALLTRNSSRIEPDVLEYKFYAKGVGPVMEISVSGGSDHTVLLEH